MRGLNASGSKSGRVCTPADDGADECRREQEEEDARLGQAPHHVLAVRLPGAYTRPLLSSTSAVSGH
jgi:hypothetical protein